MLKLREYQQAGIDGLREGFAQGHRAQLLYSPTGGGKTELAIAMMEAAAKKGTKCAMVLDRVVLCDQTSARLQKYGIDHGVLQAGHWRHRPYERIQICSAQTLEKRGFFPGMQLLIVDEAHQTRKATAELIKNAKGIKVVGLSASPFTKGLGQIYTNVVPTATTEELIGHGNLCPLRVFVAKEIDMEGAKKIAGEWSDSEVTERGIKITGDLVSEWVSKTHAIFGGPKKTIVFCASVAHGQDIAQKFAAAGYNFMAVSYKDSDELKRQIFEDFAKPDTSIHGLIAVDVLTKGFDVPDVCVGISARPFSKSLSSHVQQMGRVMRSYPGKDFALWLDHSGNYLRFKDDWDDLFSNGPGPLDDGKEKPKPEPTKKEKEAAKCPKCGHLWGNEDMCPHCGLVRVRLNLVQATPGEMEEIAGGAKPKASKDEKQNFYSELLGYARFKGYKQGWADHKYKDKFGVWPRGLENVGRPMSLATTNWLKSQFIAASKGRHAVR